MKFKKIKLKENLFLMLILFFATKISAQTTICGTVNNAQTNQPISLVNIWVDNTQIGTVTDVDGKFCLNIDLLDVEKTTLVFSKISFQLYSKEIDLRKAKNLKIALTPSSIQLEETIVSVGKNSSSIKSQTTISTIISKDIILENITQNIPELLLKQPGVSLAGTGYHTAPSIRGLSNKRVVVMVDGEKVSSERNVGAPGTYVNPFEIEKIEILKGPYSTLYGSDAVGGIVNIITKDYDYPHYAENIGGRLDLSYKSISQGKNANLSVNGKLDKFQYKFSAGYRDTDEYLEADGDKAYNSFYTEKHASAKLKYKFNENNQLLLKTYYSKGGDIGFPAVSKLVNAIHDNDDHMVVGLNYKMKNIGKYLDKIELNFTRHAHDLTADIIVHKVEVNPMDDKRIVMRKNLSGVDYIAQFDTYFKINNRFKILAGFDGYFREDIDVDATKKVYNYQLGTFIIKIDDISLAKASQRSYGFFTQADYIVSDKLNANAGVRWNYITTLQPDKPEEDRENKALSGNLGLSYAVNEKLTIKTNIGSAFRSPDIKELYMTTQTPGGMNISNTELVPEHSLNLDLAFVYKGKSNLFQLSTFRNVINNMVVLDWDYSTNPRTGTYQNIGKALLYGAEFSYNQKITDNFSGYLNMSKTYGFDVNADDELMDVPPFQLNTGLKYMLNDKLDFNLSGRYSAKEIDVAFGDTPTDAFTTFDLSARWKAAKNINLNFSVTNVLNEEYREHFYFDWIQAQGRSFNIGMNFNF